MQERKQISWQIFSVITSKKINYRHAFSLIVLQFTAQAFLTAHYRNVITQTLEENQSQWCKHQGAVARYVPGCFRSCSELLSPPCSTKHAENSLVKGDFPQGHSPWSWHCPCRALCAPTPPWGQAQLPQTMQPGTQTQC